MGKNLRFNTLWTLMAMLGALPIWAQNTINVSCPSSAFAATTVSCTVSLSLGTGVSVDSLTWGLAVTPVGSSPALNGPNLGFTSQVSNTFASGTSNGLAALSNPSPAITGNTTLGTASIPLPSGPSNYSVAITNVSASFNNNIVNVTIGPAVPVAVLDPDLGLSQTSVNFGSVTLPNSSTGQVVTLSNKGASTFSLGLATSGDFSQNNTCGGTLVTGASCTVTITFTPAQAGPRTGSLSVSVGGPKSPAVVNLFGTGVSGVVGPKVGLSKVALSFGAQATGVASGALSVTLTNNGDSSLAVSSATASNPEFAPTSNCAAVPVSGTCNISVIFTPSTTGLRTGVISIVDNASGSPHVIRLSGLGTSGSAPAIGFSSIAMNFGNQASGTTSAAGMITVTNTGTASLTITAVDVAGDFAVSGAACLTTLTAGTSCTLSITFTPSTLGVRKGSITVTDNVAPGQQVIRLFGRGI